MIQNVCPIAFFLFPNDFYGLLTTWISEIDHKDVVNVPSGGFCMFFGDFFFSYNVSENV